MKCVRVCLSVCVRVRVRVCARARAVSSSRPTLAYQTGIYKPKKDMGLSVHYNGEIRIHKSTFLRTFQTQTLEMVKKHTPLRKRVCFWDNSFPQIEWDSEIKGDCKL